MEASLARRSLLTKAADIPLPESWPTLVCKTILHVCSLAHWAIIQTRSWCADSRLQRVRLAGELDRARNEISLLQEELRIIKSRFGKIPARHRPYYPSTERTAILELKAMRGWNLTQTAHHFMVEKETVAECMNLRGRISRACCPNGSVRKIAIFFALTGQHSYKKH